MADKIKDYFRVNFEFDEDEDIKRYRSRISYNDDIFINLGFYETAEEAAFAYNTAKKYLYKDINDVLTYNIIPEDSITHYSKMEIEESVLESVNINFGWKEYDINTKYKSYIKKIIECLKNITYSINRIKDQLM